MQDEAKLILTEADAERRDKIRNRQKTPAEKRGSASPTKQRKVIAKTASPTKRRNTSPVKQRRIKKLVVEEPVAE